MAKIKEFKTITRGFQTKSNTRGFKKENKIKTRFVLEVGTIQNITRYVWKIRIENETLIGYKRRLIQHFH